MIKTFKRRCARASERRDRDRRLSIEVSQPAGDDAPGTDQGFDRDHNDLAVCTHFFGASKLLLYCDATRRGQKSPRSKNGGRKTVLETAVAARPEFGEVPLRATYFDRSVGASERAVLFVVCPPLLGEILTNVFALGRASGARNEDEPLQGGRRRSPDSHRGVRGICKSRLCQY